MVLTHPLLLLLFLFPLPFLKMSDNPSPVSLRKVVEKSATAPVSVDEKKKKKKKNPNLFFKEASDFRPTLSPVADAAPPPPPSPSRASTPAPPPPPSSSNSASDDAVVPQDLRTSASGPPPPKKRDFSSCKKWTLTAYEIERSGAGDGDSSVDLDASTEGEEEEEQKSSSSRSSAGSGVAGGEKEGGEESSTPMEESSQQLEESSQQLEESSQQPPARQVSAPPSSAPPPASSYDARHRPEALTLNAWVMYLQELKARMEREALHQAATQLSGEYTWSQITRRPLPIGLEERLVRLRTANLEARGHHTVCLQLDEALTELIPGRKSDPTSLLSPLTVRDPHWTERTGYVWLAQCSGYFLQKY